MAARAVFFAALLMSVLCGLSPSPAISDAVMLVQSGSMLRQRRGDADDPFKRYEVLTAATDEPLPRSEELEDEYSFDGEEMNDSVEPPAQRLGELGFKPLTPSKLGVVDGPHNGSRAMRNGQLRLWPGSATYPLPTANSTNVCNDDDRVLFFHYIRRLVRGKGDGTIDYFQRCSRRYWHGVNKGGLEVAKYNDCLATNTHISVPCGHCLGSIANYAFYYYALRPRCHHYCMKKTTADLGISGKMNICSKKCYSCLAHLGPYFGICLDSQYWSDFCLQGPAGAVTSGERPRSRGGAVDLWMVARVESASER